MKLIQQRSRARGRDDVALPLVQSKGLLDRRDRLVHTTCAPKNIRERVEGIRLQPDEVGRLEKLDGLACQSLGICVLSAASEGPRQSGPPPGLCIEIIGARDRSALLGEPHGVVVTALPESDIHEHGSQGCSNPCLAHRGEQLVTHAKLSLGSVQVTTECLG